MYTDPSTTQDWQDVAHERRADALAMRQLARQVSCVYHLGFTAECYAKALCVARGRTVPRSHNVLDILEHAGFSSTVLPSEIRVFLADRDVGLRYQVALPDDVRIEDQVEAATRFVKWCATQLRRRAGRPGARVKGKERA
ncbi:HEPN domain-containing protein [Streptomyces sp. NPDC088674]|uniref:HEPN domain-containing protein n=1 Tax=Streptomyces sp. NPDC088674 TaxID=3365869 RepID=UPI0037F875AE